MEFGPDTLEQEAISEAHVRREALESAYVRVTEASNPVSRFLASRTLKNAEIRFQEANAFSPSPGADA